MSNDPGEQGADADYGNLDAHLTNTCRLRPRPSPEASSSEDEDDSPPAGSPPDLAEAMRQQQAQESEAGLLPGVSSFAAVKVFGLKLPDFEKQLPDTDQHVPAVHHDVGLCLLSTVNRQQTDTI